MACSRKPFSILEFALSQTGDFDALEWQFSVLKDLAAFASDSLEADLVAVAPDASLEDGELSNGDHEQGPILPDPITVARPGKSSDQPAPRGSCLAKGDKPSGREKKMVRFQEDQDLEERWVYEVSSVKTRRSKKKKRDLLVA
eukprot:TRINITY_DN63958_c0_g1_i1.p1 TRINITY_DN63958_c0_g1~~TRINITY_DN63958_c0_g1_i1.p1  ORF type:complete len:143 (+),score=14.05 TRINITY_DN63958_c0_g1_i1:54-482(+)